MNKTITICVIILLLGLTESKKSLKDLINKGISEKRNIEKEKEIFKKIFGENSVYGSNLYNKVMHYIEGFISRKLKEEDAQRVKEAEKNRIIENRRSKAKRRAEKRRAKQREVEIEMYKEAYLRAMNEFYLSYRN